MSFKQLSLPFTLNQLLLLLTSFLIAFIPLFPKVPLFDVLPGYIVRLRLEDVLVGFAFLIWIIQVFRKKISWNTPLTILFSLYLLFGLLSIISAVFWLGTIPITSADGSQIEILHLGKSLLHYFRNFEYFTLFLIAYSSINSKKDAMIIVWGMVFTFIAVGIYGLGQRYLLWPAYSTMNREFSKGIALQLTEHARVQSTFGGHYDLGGYLVLIIPLIMTLQLTMENKWVKRGLFVLFLVGTWLVVVSASRISFGGYVIGMYVVLLILMLKQQENWKTKLWWGFKHALLYSVVVLSIFAIYGQDLAERYTHFLNKYPQVATYYHQLNGKRKTFMYDTVPVFFGWKDPYKPDQPVVTTNNGGTPLTPTDERPVPKDVDTIVPEKVILTQVVAEDGSVSYEVTEVDRNYSTNAIKYGLSLAIRLDSTWPHALEGFKRNPLLGSGYATLNKEGVYHFTEADSSDNNFLRTLGENGILGFSAFYGTIVMALVWCWRWLRTTTGTWGLTDVLTISFVAGTIGLLINALMIDIFVSSKVAFMFWAFTGVVLAMINLSFKQKNSTAASNS